MAGQKQIPVSSAGCYVPGGRYSHIASAIMTITTATLIITIITRVTTMMLTPTTTAIRI